MRDIVKEDWTNEGTVRCNCGCGELQFTQWKEDGFAYLSYNIPAFYAYQRPLRQRIKEGFAIIWSVLTGRQYRLFEVIIMNNKQLESLKEFAENIVLMKEEE